MATSGALSVTLTSLWKLPVCCAESYSVAQSSLFWEELTLDKEMERSGLKNSCVRGMSPIFHSAQ